MKRIPVIGVTAGVDESGRVSVSESYLRTIWSVGAAAVVLSPVTASHEIWYQSQAIDALVLSGGGDVCPLLCGEEPQRGIGRVDKKRDVWEIALCRLIERAGRPILGICRGMQVMNIALGGDVWQDISARSVLCHQQTSAHGTTWHTVRFRQGSRMESLFGSQTDVNSYHHQAVRNIADGLMITGTAPDGIAESIEGRDGWLVGVQFHPELLSNMRPLWQSLAEAANEK